MPGPALMDAAQFRRVAQTCRWSERSLAVARALLVDGEPLSKVAAAHQMSPQQAQTLRKRFADKAAKLRLAKFIQREPPKRGAALLAPFATDVRKLQERDYTVEQIVSYLKDNGVETTATTVRKFIRSLQT